MAKIIQFQATDRALIWLTDEGDLFQLDQAGRRLRFDPALGWVELESSSRRPSALDQADFSDGVAF